MVIVAVVVVVVVVAGRCCCRWSLLSLVVVVVVVAAVTSCLSHRRGRAGHVGAIVGTSSSRHWRATRGASLLFACPPYPLRKGIASSSDKVQLIPRRGWLGGRGSGDDVAYAL